MFKVVLLHVDDDVFPLTAIGDMMTNFKTFETILLLR